MNTNDKNTFAKTKFQVPQVGSKLVPRHRLYQLLNERLPTSGDREHGLRFNQKLTLVVAPAGYGKTTLVASWLQGVACQSAWISLDEYDNSLSLFVRALVGAIRNIFPNSCANTIQLIREAQHAPPEHIATVLINDIDSLQELILLVLDDYHLIHSDAIQSLITRLIEIQPPNLHLAIISRADPLLPLHRLRASGEMTEIRRSDLRFTDDEAETFLVQRLALAIDREAIAALNGRTEGWIVGLWLAVLSIRGQKDLYDLLDKFKDKPTAYVNEYLLAEVLDQQPETIRAYMLQTAILKRLSGSLCEAVTGIDAPQWSGQAYLEWIVSANLFVIPLDAEREWFRYHHLFQNFLVNRLRASYSTDEINVLHCRASRWFAEQGDVEQAIQHAIAGHDVDAAVTLVEQQSQNLLNSQDRSTLQRWLDSLPQDVVRRRPILLIAKAWLLLREWRLTALESVLDVAESLFDSAPLPAKSDPLAAQITALRSSTACMLWNDFQRALPLAIAAQEQLPPTERGALGVTEMVKAFSQQALGRGELSSQALEAIVQSPSQVGPSKIQAFIGLAALQHLTGRLQRMSQTMQQFQTLAGRRNHPNAVAAANNYSGWLSYEWNALHEAAGHFEVAIAHRYQANFAAYFDAAIGMTRVQLAYGHIDQAQSIIGKLHAEALHLNSTDLLSPIQAFQAYLWTVQEDVPAALRWARSVNPRELYECVVLSELASLLQARILIWYGTDAEVTTTINYLKTKLAHAQTYQFTRWTIQTEIHLALAYQRQADSDQALSIVEQAIDTARSGGFIRSFVEFGQPMERLLTALSGRLPVDGDSYLNQLLISFELDNTPQPPLLGPQSQFMTPAFQSPLVESITRRELEVLRLMQIGQTDQEIADGLIIALSTARRHASNIYRKLEVHNRRQAVRKAEQLGLLSTS